MRKFAEYVFTVTYNNLVMYFFLSRMYVCTLRGFSALLDFLSYGPSCEGPGVRFTRELSCSNTATVQTMILCLNKPQSYLNSGVRNSKSEISVLSRKIEKREICQMCNIAEASEKQGICHGYRPICERRAVEFTDLRIRLNAEPCRCPCRLTSD